MTNKSTVMRRSDYSGSDYLITNCNLHIDLDATTSVVTSILSIKHNPESVNKSADLILNGEGIELLSVKINGKTITAKNYALTDELLTLSNLPNDDFELEIINNIYPNSNTLLSGIYESGDIICSQCEARGFRRITYFLDRPDILSIYTVTLVGDKTKYPILLSNGDLISSDSNDLADNKHTVTWIDPWLKPCYLFAVVAGDLNVLSDEFITRSGKVVDLKILVQDGYEDKVQWAMDSLKRSMKWDEDTYDREYDLNVFHVVAIDKFNAGAMENKSLNIFNVSLLVGTPEISTDNELVLIEAVVGHEYFHNWSGNRVTVRDWFELSLKEGLTVLRDRQFTADLYSADMQIINDANELKAGQFVEDSGPSSHPIRPELVEEFDNIYSATVYTKGSHVLGMLKTILGNTAWRKAMNHYFVKFDGQAVSCDDFVDAMQESSGIDLSMFRKWYSQSGTPEIEYDGCYDDKRKTYKLTLKQNTNPTHDQKEKSALLMPISVGLIDHDGNDIDLVLENDNEISKTKVLMLDKNEQSFTFKNVDKDVVPSVLRGFSAPVKIKTIPCTEELLLRMSHDSDGYNRNEAATVLKNNIILSVEESLRKGDAPIISESFFNAYEELLSSAIQGDSAFNANILQLPKYGMVSQLMPVIYPHTLISAIKYVKEQLLGRFEGLYMDIFNATATNADDVYAVEHTQIGRRALHNCMLEFLMDKESSNSISYATIQFEKSQNMTDKLVALRLLSYSKDNAGVIALNSFFEKFKCEANVLDKWLALQATNPNDDCVGNIKSIMKQSVFDITNPNKVRSLIAQFAMNNPTKFHAEDGSGYQLLADTIIRLNDVNPATAARMCTPFLQWKRYDTSVQKMIQIQMERIMNIADLKTAISELIGKALSQ